MPVYQERRKEWPLTSVLLWQTYFVGHVSYAVFRGTPQLVSARFLRTGCCDTGLVVSGPPALRLLFVEVEGGVQREVGWWLHRALCGVCREGS